MEKNSRKEYKNMEKEDLVKREKELETQFDVKKGELIIDEMNFLSDLVDAIHESIETLFAEKFDGEVNLDIAVGEMLDMTKRISERSSLLKKKYEDEIISKYRKRN